MTSTDYCEGNKMAMPPLQSPRPATSQHSCQAPEDWWHCRGTRSSGSAEGSGFREATGLLGLLLGPVPPPAQ